MELTEEQIKAIATKHVSTCSEQVKCALVEDVENAIREALAASAPTLGDSDPCPFCPSGTVCKTPKCGRLAQNAPAVAQPSMDTMHSYFETIVKYLEAGLPGLALVTAEKARALLANGE